MLAQLGHGTDGETEDESRKRLHLRILAREE